jgi:alpha-ketoglutarate-dependent taurine dioxygenase
MQVHVARTGSQSWRALWSIHHLVHDAWSLSILLRDVFTAYTQGAALPAAPPYSRFLQVIRGVPLEDAEEYWRTSLAGWKSPTPLPLDRADSDGGTAGHQEFQLDSVATANVSAVLRSRQLTWNSLVLGVWAMLLAAWSGRLDVVFGTVLLGRMKQVEEAGEIVGPFINTLPFRARCGGNKSVSDWLNELQRQLAAMAEFEHTPLNQIRAWLAPSGPALFDSILVFQNAFQSLAGKRIGGIEIGAISSAGHPNYPLMLRVTPGECCRFELVHDPRRFSGARAGRLLEQVQSAIRFFQESPDATVQNWSRSLMSTAQKPAGRRLRDVTPRGVSGTVAESVINRGGTRVRILEATHASLDLIRWTAGNRELLLRHLAQEGAVLLRGFPAIEAHDLEAVLAAAGGPALPYKERSSPRTQVAGNIYTSTEYPAHQPIFLHNENSYAHVWPRKIAFYCERPAGSGGATPLADVRRVYERIPEKIRTRLEKSGVLYVRNFGDGVGLSWRTAFQTGDAAAVEAYCRDAGYEAEWLGVDRLRTRRVGQAVVRHPDTGEPIWFNHAAFFHVSTLTPEVRDGLLAQFAESDLPNQTYAGDGTSISGEDAAAIRQAYIDSQLTFPWRAGDLLLLDNMLVAHGRESFEGSRRVLVGMAEPFESGRIGNLV